jgi:hypothetical protein
VKKIALGETLPVKIINVEEVKPDKFKIKIQDDEGYVGVVYLDVEMPLGTAELKLIHIGEDREKPKPKMHSLNGYA